MNQRGAIHASQAYAQGKMIDHSGWNPSISIFSPQHGQTIKGHNRYSVCERHGIDFNVTTMEFDDRRAAEDWIDRNQAGRRNISPADYRILVGRIYNRRKNLHGGDRKSSCQLGNLNDKTGETVAEEFGLSERSVNRHGERADLHDSFLVENNAQAAEATKHVPQQVVSEAKKQPSEQAAETVKKAHVSNNSGENEWYTPPEILEAARSVLQEIDLDPASCERANQSVQASKIFTKNDDGLSHEWSGRVWMNPPYAQPLIAKFCERLCDQVECGNVKQAIVLVNNATETRWFQSLSECGTAVCFPSGRIRFVSPEGEKGQPLQGQAIVYMGSDTAKFHEQFSQFGKCWNAI